jgi:hypothetical protein
LGYSEGALVPSGITVSPAFDVKISRLDFILNNDKAGNSIKGFSRATEISWSLFGQKPFLEINLGPSILEDYAAAKSVYLYTAPFQKIDWPKVALVANISSLSLNSLAKMYSLTVGGNLSLESENLSNVYLEAEQFSSTNGNSTFTSQLIRGELSELNFNTPLISQFFSTTFEFKDLVTSEPNFTAQEASFEVVLAENVRNLRIDLRDANLLDSGGFIKNVKVDGSFNQSNILQKLQMDLVDGFLSKKSPIFPQISVGINKLDDEQYEVYIEGSLDESELSASDNFIGTLPSINFTMDSEVNKAASIVISKSKISFDVLSLPDLNGSLEMSFDPKSLTMFECALWKCQLSDFDLAYEITLNEEWVRGSASCPKGLCEIQDMDYWVRTSNTGNIFTILNRANILSPISSLYLYGAISSGQKINGGHVLKLQF